MFDNIRRSVANWIAPTRRSRDDPGGMMQHGFASPALGTLAGPAITSRSALSIAAVWQAVSCIVDTVSTLPLFVAERDDRGGRKPARDHQLFELLNLKPNRRSNSMRLRQAWIGHAATRGNGYLEIEFETRRRGVKALHLLDPRDIQPFEIDGQVVYRQKSGGPDIPSWKMLHLAMFGWDGVRGYSPVEHHAESLGLAKSQTIYQSGLMGNGAQTQGHLEFPGKLTPIQKQQEREAWNRMHQGANNAGVLGILSEGVKYVSTSFSPQDAELILGCHFSVEEIGRIWNVPLFKLGLPGFGKSEEEETAQFLKWTIRPWVMGIEQELDLKLLSCVERISYFIFHDMSALQRGNIATETAQQKEDLGSGVATLNDIHRRRGLELIDHPFADYHWIPTNNLTPIEKMDEPGASPTTQPAMSQPGGQGSQGTPEPAVVATVQDTALNGAQIASFLEVISAVTGGTLPAESAKGILESSFPTVSLDQLDKILAPLANIKPPAPPVPSDGPDPAGAARGVVREAVERMLKVECNAIQRAARKDRLDLWVDDFYPKHVPKLVDAMAGPLALMGMDRGVAMLLASDWSLDSRRAMRDLFATTPPDEMPAAVEKLCGSWHESRARLFVDGIGGGS